MNLTVKTLKGGKFTIEAEPSNTVAELKVVIENAKPELPAASMKLIHSGKVLKDDAKIEGCNIKPNDFLVVMIAKAKKTAAPKPAVAPAAAAATAAPTEAAASSDTAAVPTTPAPPTGGPPTPAAPGPSTAAATSAPTPAAPAPSTVSSPLAAESGSSSAAAAPAGQEFPADVVNNLMTLGFPEAEVRACLAASNGNPDVAVEFLMNGIPPGIGGGAGGSGAPAAAGGSGASLDALRNHPQFNDLRRLVQTNPGALQAVLTQIGQQQPELLRAINSNQQAFLQMMNEPITDAPAAAPSSAPTDARTGAGAGAAGGVPPGMEALGNPAQLAQMLQSMPPAEQQAMAAAMGMTAEQLQQTADAISRMPPEQVQQYMNMAMQAQGMMGEGGGGMAGLQNLMGGGGGGGGGEDGANPYGGGQQVLRLSEEEMAAVDRLTDMGFDRAEAAQAYLACDKNEALAANLLMDGGFGFGADGDVGGNDGGGDDDMYD